MTGTFGSETDRSKLVSVFTSFHQQLILSEDDCSLYFHVGNRQFLLFTGAFCGVFSDFDESFPAMNSSSIKAKRNHLGHN